MSSDDVGLVEDRFSGLKDMDLPIAEFVDAFRRIPALARKVSITTGVPEPELKALGNEDLLSLFEGLDTDVSGTLSFAEFVDGLLAIRQQRAAFDNEAAQLEEGAMLEEARRNAAIAFNDADFAHQGELDLQGFIDALQDESLAEKVGKATSLPHSFFESLTEQDLAKFFNEIDVDHNGAVSFSEWVMYLVKVRQVIHRQEKIEQEEALQAVLDHAEAALEEGDEDWSGEFDLQEFLKAFRSNPRFLRKVSLATDVPVSEFKQFEEEALENLFQSLDTDFSGTISFDEFVKGLVEIRLARKGELLEEADRMKQLALDEAYMEAVEAFQDADFNYTGELDFNSFLDALNDPSVVDKVMAATGLPQRFFVELDRPRMLELFRSIDADSNGTVSFNEWVSYLVQIRERTFLEEQALIEAEAKEVSKFAEEALEEGDEDWSGELDFQEFLNAFRSNPRFLRKISLATNVPVSDFKSLADEDLGALFNSLDSDFSGTVSFEEFVNGLLEIRRARRAQLDETAILAEEAVLDGAFDEAAAIFNTMEFGVTGELELEDFIKAMNDPEIVGKVAKAMRLPQRFFESLTAEGIKELFIQMDLDSSGRISFNEWVLALMDLRRRQYQIAKAEADALRQAMLRDAEDALDAADEDWSGEFELEEFLKAFKSNMVFLKKVAHATGVPVENFQELREEDLSELFQALDTDFSGSVSFEEFIRGLIEIRLANNEMAGQEESPIVVEPKQTKRPAFSPPADVQRLPPLTEIDRALLREAFAKFTKNGLGFHCTAENVAELLQDLHLIIDEKAASKYIDQVFNGYDTSCGLTVDQTEWLYKVALNAQPLWQEPLRRCASGKDIRASDVLHQEDRLRKLFSKHSDKKGLLQDVAIPQFFKSTGLMDHASFTPRCLEEFQKKRKPGPIRFPEVVDLCNNSISLAVESAKNAKLPLTKSASLSSIGSGFGAPKLSLRSMRHGSRDHSQLAARGLLVLESTKALGRSESTGRLKRF